MLTSQLIGWWLEVTLNRNNYLYRALSLFPSSSILFWRMTHFQTLHLSVLQTKRKLGRFISPRILAKINYFSRFKVFASFTSGWDHQWFSTWLDEHYFLQKKNLIFLVQRSQRKKVSNKVFVGWLSWLKASTFKCNWTPSQLNWYFSQGPKRQNSSFEENWKKECLLPHVQSLESSFNR